MFELVDKCLNNLARFCCLSGAVLTLAMMALICADVAGRNLFDKPLSSVPELISLALVAVVFLQLPLAVREGRLPQSTLFLDYVRNRAPLTGNMISVLFQLLSALAMAIIAYYSWPLLIKAFVRDTYTGSIGSVTVALWPVKLIIVFSCAQVSLQYLIGAVRTLTYHNTRAA